MELAVGVGDPVPEGFGLEDREGEGEAAGTLLEKYQKPPATATIATTTNRSINQVKSFPFMIFSYYFILDELHVSPSLRLS